MLSTFSMEETNRYRLANGKLIKVKYIPLTNNKKIKITLTVDDQILFERILEREHGDQLFDTLTKEIENLQLLLNHYHSLGDD